jgi:hypothetical protein
VDAPDRERGYTPQDPPKPTVTRPPSTMSGTRRDPPESCRKRRIASGSAFTSWYSTETPLSPKSSRAAFV